MSLDRYKYRHSQVRAFKWPETHDPSVVVPDWCALKLAQTGFIVEPGQWVVMKPDTSVGVYTPAEFEREFEPAGESWVGP